MNKREITHNNLEQMFDSILEQAPLVSEKQVNALLVRSTQATMLTSIQRFFQYHLNTILLVVLGVVIVVAALFWINSDKINEAIVVENTTKENGIAAVPSDSILLEEDTLIVQVKEADSVLVEPDVKSGSANNEVTTISLPDIFKHFEKKAQVFSIKADEDTTIVCTEGTRIRIKAHSFISEKTGGPISGTIQFEVKEFYKMSDIILANLSTTSGNKILETGGMLRITASASGEKCVVAPGQDIEIGFPYSTKKDNMELFYGEQKDDIVDWKPAYGSDNVVIKDKLIIVDAPGIERQEEETQVFFIVEEMPEYPGGDKALKKYMEENAIYPYSALKDGVEGKVYVTFVVDRSGYPNNIRVVRSLDKKLDKVAVYAVSNMPKWKPGKQRGKAVNVSYTVPVSFYSKMGELSSDEIQRSKELEVKLKDFQFDVETNSYSNNSRIFNELEKKVNNDSLQASDIREVNRYVFSATQLGWINCDRFYSSNKLSSNIFVRTDASSKTIVNAVSRQFKSLIRGRDRAGKIVFNNIPMGEQLTIVALKTVNGKILLSVKDIEVKGAGEIVLDFKPVSMDLLKKEMEKLNNYY